MYTAASLFMNRVPRATVASGGAAEMDEPTPSRERDLVEALMLRGWYRDGRAGGDAEGRVLWRFRSGHNLDDLGRKVVLVRARSQQAAMRALLARLEQTEAEPNLAAN